MAEALNYAVMKEQWGDEERGRFSYTDVEQIKEQRCCWITYTIPKFTKHEEGLKNRLCLPAH